MSHGVGKSAVGGTRVYGLDIVRAVAIIAVIWGHSDTYIPAQLHAVFSYTTLDGVSIFFVLSGFLIGGILLKILESKPASLPTLWQFWVRRWLRTVPSYLLVLLVLALIPFVFGNGVTGLGSYLLFSQNFATPHPDFFGEAWSLTVEEWFYLITPVLIFVIMRIFHRGPRWSVLLAAICILSAVTLFRYYRFTVAVPASLNEWDMLFRKQVVTRLDSLMYGIIGAYVFRYFHDWWNKYRNISLALGLLLVLSPRFIPFIPGSIYATVFSFTQFSVGTLLCLPFLSRIKHGSGWIYRSVTRISLISYSLYLVNFSLVQYFIIEDVIDRRFDIGNFAKMILYWGISIGLANLLYQYFEVPVMTLRERITSGRRRQTKGNNRIQSKEVFSIPLKDKMPPKSSDIIEV